MFCSIFIMFMLLYFYDFVFVVSPRLLPDPDCGRMGQGTACATIFMIFRLYLVILKNIHFSMRKGRNVDWRDLPFFNFILHIFRSLVAAF